jgi:hypothetical protein
MTWINDMKTDALALAAPGFELHNGDRIEIEMHASPGGHLSSVTFEPGYVRIMVEVWRPTSTDIGEPGWDGPLRFREGTTGRTWFYAFQRCYLDDEAPEFFAALMERGTGRERTRWTN